MADDWHVAWLREGVKAWNARRRKVSFSPNLAGVNFFDLLPPDFRDSPKTSRFFEKIDLSLSDLSGANLSGLNFRGADFSLADLSSANMGKTNFMQAKFFGTKLSDAEFDGSVFSDAVFESVEFSETILSGADIRNAVFISANAGLIYQSEFEKRGASLYSSARQYKAQKSENIISFISRAPTKLDATAQADADGNRKIEEKIPKYDVMFATNRQSIYERGVLVDFNAMRSSDLTYGICEVKIPEGRRVGSLGSSIFGRVIKGVDDRIKLSKLITLNEALFWSYFNRISREMNRTETPAIFVHGYNTSFLDAVLRSAQIGYDLGFGRGISLFSWPSAGSALAYKSDEAACEASKNFLADFIEAHIKNSPNGKICLLAHSMGCRCTLAALEVIYGRNPLLLSSIENLVLAAADVDSGVMPNIKANGVGTVKNITSYACEQDIALAISSWLHGYPRVGFAPPVFVLNGIDTIVVNDRSLGDFSHGYMGSSRDVLNDLYQLLKTCLPPSSRFALERHQDAGGLYWKLKN